MKISKGQSETINLQTDNTLAKKGLIMIYKTLHRKLRLSGKKPHKKSRGELRYSKNISSTCSTSKTSAVLVQLVKRQQYLLN